jgi:hypothetical protein
VTHPADGTLRMTSSSPLTSRDAHQTRAEGVPEVQMVTLPAFSPSPRAGAVGEPDHADAVFPMLLPGVDPGYDVPEHTVAPGSPRDGERYDSTARDSLPDEEWSMLKKLGPHQFTDNEWYKGVYVLGATGRNDAEQALLDWFDDFRALFGDANRLAFAGHRQVRYPWRVSTDTAQGPTKLAYTVSHTVTRTETETKGLTAGGSLTLSVGQLGNASFTGSYSHSWTNSTSWSSADTVASDMTIDAGTWGRIDVFATGGVYDGYPFAVLGGLPEDDDGYRYFDLNGSVFRVDAGYIAFRMRNFFVKSPNSPSPGLRVQRDWPDGTPAPNTDFPDS